MPFEFDNNFAVQAPLETVWQSLTDPYQVAPCVPGAEITEKIDDIHYKGRMRIKLGPVQMSYRGDFEMHSDDSDRSIVLKARGKDAKGLGSAATTITTRVNGGDDGATQVQIHSSVDIAGRVAQFGRGIITDIANRMIGQFANCLEQKLKSG